MNPSCNVSPSKVGKDRMDNVTTYNIKGKTFIVQPVFKTDGKETLGTILMRLMQSDSENA